MFATDYSSYYESYPTFALLATLPGIASAVWSYWKRRGSVILSLLCLASLLVGFVMVRVTYTADQNWFYRISPFLPIASGAIGILSPVQKRDDAS